MTASATPVPWLTQRVSLRDTSPVVLVPRLSVFLLIATASRSTNRLLFALAVAVLLFGFDRLSRNGVVWIGIGIVVAGWNLLDWHRIDNHIILSSYWYLALGAALLAEDRERQLSVNARLLVGVAFAVAVLRKVTSVEFMTGDFFVFTLLSDPRFEPAATMVGGAAETLSNRMALAGLPAAATFTSGSGIRALALALTWGAVLVETAVAVFNLLPAKAWRRAGQLSLAAFITITYLIVPVVAFGTGLIVMGAASAASDRARVAWAIGFFVLAVWGYGWQAVVL